MDGQCVGQRAGEGPYYVTRTGLSVGVVIIVQIPHMCRNSCEFRYHYVPMYAVIITSPDTTLYMCRNNCKSRHDTITRRYIIVVELLSKCVCVCVRACVCMCIECMYVWVRARVCMCTCA